MDDEPEDGQSACLALILSPPPWRTQGVPGSIEVGSLVAKDKRWAHSAGIATQRKVVKPQDVARVNGDKHEKIDKMKFHKVFHVVH